MAGRCAHLTLEAVGATAAQASAAPTSVSLFDQGLMQVLEAAVTGLAPRQPYVLALSTHARWRRARATSCGLHDEPGWIGHRQRDRSHSADRWADAGEERRYLVILSGAAETGAPVQVQGD